jgi:outer membrane protein OmpA-like peptidoglycan-associated protein
LKLPIIYFDFDKSFIRPDAAIELAKILAAMRQYPELIIHIESHTDARGKDIYNEKLSGRRAQSTKKWLIANGIAASRLSAKGYGEYQLTNQCSNGVECSEQEHQLNRRSMFIIQN